MFAAGGMYWNISNDVTDGTFDRAASSFYILVTIAFTPPFTIITVWQDERTLVRREVNQNVYSLGVFFWAKTLVLLPVEGFFSFLVRTAIALPACIACMHACALLRWLTSQATEMILGNRTVLKRACATRHVPLCCFHMLIGVALLAARQFCKSKSGPCGLL
jgi:hypothetical protein